MTKSLLLETMRVERQQWEAALDAIGLDRMTQPGVAGHWSAKDVISHNTAYERWVLDQLEAMARGEPAAPSVLDDGDMQRRNTAVYDATRALPLPDVLAEAQRVWRRLTQLVEDLPEDDLIEVSRAPQSFRRYWSTDTALWEVIANLTYEHYQEHLPDLHAWANASDQAPAG